MSNGTVKNDVKPKSPVQLTNKRTRNRANQPKATIEKQFSDKSYIGKVKGKPFPLARKVGQLGRQ